MAVRLDLVPMGYCVRYANAVLPKCLMPNLVMSNSVVNLDLDFECAIYCWHSDGICGMVWLEFVQRSAVLAGSGFD